MNEKSKSSKAKNPGKKTINNKNPLETYKFG